MTKARIIYLLKLLPIIVGLSFSSAIMGETAVVEPQTLITFNQTLDKGKDALSSRRSSVNVFINRLINTSDEDLSRRIYQAQLFTDTTLSITFEPPKHTGNSTTFSGRTADSTLDNVLLTLAEGSYLLTAYQGQKGYRYTILGQLDNQQAIVSEIMLKAPSCQTQDTDKPSFSIRPRSPDTSPMLSYTPRSLQSLLPAKKATIDLMIIYDKAAQQWLNQPIQQGGYNGNKNLFKNALINHLNQVMQNSKLNINFQVVHQMSVDDKASPGKFLRNTIIEIDQGFTTQSKDIRKARNDHHADLVIWLTHVTENPYGIAAQLETRAGNADIAYSVSDITDALGQTVIHEIGHNLGAAHAKSNDPESSGPNKSFGDYAAGWYFDNGNNFYNTVMAYQTAHNQQSALVFSSPDIRYQGLIPGDKKWGDNRRVLIQTAGVVSAYRRNPSTATTLTLNQALDNDTLTFTTDGDARWFGQNDIYAKTPGNKGSAQSPLLQKNQFSHLRTQVTGPGMLTFKAKAETYLNYSGNDTFIFTLDGQQQRNLDSSAENFLTHQVPIPSGKHTLAWTFNNQTGSDSAKGWVDEVKFMPTTLTSPAEALDNTELAFILSGKRRGHPDIKTPWFAQTLHRQYGKHALQASDYHVDKGGYIAHYNLRINSVINSPDGGTLSFYWSTSVAKTKKSDGSCESGFIVSVDNHQKAELCGETPFKEKHLEIPAGNYYITWLFVGDLAYTSRYNTGYLDRVSFTPKVDNPKVGLGIYNVYGQGGEVDCSHRDNIPKNTLVSCTATTTEQGYRFKQWAGVCSGQTGTTCRFKITKNSSVAAIFNKESTLFYDGFESPSN